MCICQAQRLITWLGSYSNSRIEIQSAIDAVKTDLDRWTSDRYTKDNIRDYLKSKRYNKYYEYVPSITAYYQGHDIDETIPCIPYPIQLKIVELLQQLLDHKKQNLCVHWGYIVIRCLLMLGEYELAKRHFHIFYGSGGNNKKAMQRYDQTWLNAFEDDEYPILMFWNSLRSLSTRQRII